MNYREDLPAGCPPEDAQLINSEWRVYRLTATRPPTEEDFKSLGFLHPEKKYPERCLASGVSVWLDRKDAEMTSKLPTQAGKVICPVVLRLGAGKIKKTRKLSHHTWWPFLDYNILGNCQTEAS